MEQKRTEGGPKRDREGTEERSRERQCDKGKATEGEPERVESETEREGGET